jgi:3-hydroxybutyryl-CoA dehydrogenase
MTVDTLGVIGAGQMGAGIAQAGALAGLNIVLNDVSEELCRRGAEAIARNLDRMVQRGRLKSDERDTALRRIRAAARLEELERADFVIEAIVEDEAAKIALFERLDRICPPGVIFASNTSSISITRMAARTGRAEHFIGMHFFNPVALMKLVEITRGLATSPQAYEATRALAERLGKSVIVAEDSPGFIVNRILVPMINEAVFTLYEGVATITDIDTAMKLGTNHPMGPLELADLVGLDTCLAVIEVMHRVLGDDKYRPCPLLRKYVDAGYLGRKTGRGFYSYDRDGNPIPPSAAGH